MTEAVDETAYLLSSENNKSNLHESLQSLEEGKGITFSVQELEEKFGAK